MDSNQPGTSSEIVRPIKRARLTPQSSTFLRDLEDLVNEELEDDSDSDPDFVIESEHDSDTDQSDTEVIDGALVGNHSAAVLREGEGQVENQLEINNRQDDIDEEDENQLTGPAEAPRHRGDRTYYYGRRTKQMISKHIPAFKWRRDPGNQNVRTRQENIVTQLPGLTRRASNLGSNPDPQSVWGLLISDDMLNEIIRWTNAKISIVRANYTNPTSYIKDIDLVELKSFIGLLIYSAVFKSGHEAASSLFATDGTGREIFRCVMTKERFLFVLHVLRFDNSEDRHERKKEMKEAAIGELFYKFIENSQSCYKTGLSVCIDEMLVPFRGRSSFKMYIPNKPAKYGIKVQCLTDAKTNYLFNAYIYVGKGSDGRGLTPDQQSKLLIPTQAVIKLVAPIENTRKNVTADNWYSSIQLVQELDKKGLTYVGTLKKNKIEVPQVFLADKNKEEKSVMYGFTEKITLLSYVPKKSKAVLLVSSMHFGPETDSDTGKPEIIAEYNRTKGGVDTLDQMCSNYSTQRRCRRWPLTIFFTIVNVSAGVNSYVLYKAYKDTPNISRIDFMKTLAKSLVTPQLLRRLETGGQVRDEMKDAIRRILLIPRPDPQGIDVFPTRKTCYTCDPKLKRRTKYPCSVCEKPICLECAKKVCVPCHVFLNNQ